MTPLAMVRHERFTDIDGTNEFVPEETHESVQLEASPTISEYQQIAYPDLIVTKMRDEFARADGYRMPEGTTGFALPLPSSEHGIWCGFEVPSDVLVTQHGAHDFFSVLPASGLGMFQIVVDDLLVDQWRLLPDAVRNTPDIGSHHLIPLAEESAAELREWLDSWFDPPERADVLARDLVASAEFREGLLERLAVFIQGVEGDPRPSLVGRPLERYRLVQAALDHIEQGLADLTGAQDLADALDVSPRRLQYAFADVLRTSPYQYLLIRKLHVIRHELRRRCRPDTTVSRVASRYGFRDLGRFSERYRRFFGELPSETLAEGCTEAPS